MLDPDFECADSSPAGRADTPAPEYPRSSGGAAPGGDSSSRRSRWASMASRATRRYCCRSRSSGFAAAAVEAWLNSRFVPAMRHGVRGRVSRCRRSCALSGSHRQSGAARAAYQAALRRPTAKTRPRSTCVGLTADLDSLARGDARARGTNAHERRTRRRPGRTVLGRRRRCARRRRVIRRRTRACGCDTRPRAAARSAAVVEAEQLLRAQLDCAGTGGAGARAARARGGHRQLLRAASTPWRCSRPPRWRRCAIRTLALQARPSSCSPVRSSPIRRCSKPSPRRMRSNKDFREASAQQRVAITKASALGWEHGRHAARG